MELSHGPDTDALLSLQTNSLVVVQAVRLPGIVRLDAAGPLSLAIELDRQFQPGIGWFFRDVHGQAGVNIKNTRPPVEARNAEHRDAVCAFAVPVLWNVLH